MDEPIFSNEISERKLAMIAYYASNLGVNPNNIHFIKTEERIIDLASIDIAVFEPVAGFDYYVAMTAGLSEYFFRKNFARSELCVVLPKTWKPVFDKEENFWVLNLLKDVAYAMVENKVGANVGQVYLFADKDEKYSEYTDAVGAILTFPEMFPPEMYEVEYGPSYTRFLQVVPITQNDVEKIDTMGPVQFIKFELHDSEGPTTVVKLKERQLTAIDKLVQRNEASLNNNTPVTNAVQSVPVTPAVQPAPVAQPAPKVAPATIAEPVKRVRRTSAKKTTSTRRATTKRKPTTRRTTK